MVLKNSNTLQIQSLLTMGANKIKNKLNTFYSQSTKLGTKANRSKKKKKKAANNSNLNQILITPMYVI